MPKRIVIGLGGTGLEVIRSGVRPGARIEELLVPLSNDKDCLLLYVEIPHR